PQILRIVDEMALFVFGNDLKAVLHGYGDCVDQSAMDRVCYLPDVRLWFSFNQRNADERHSDILSFKQTQPIDGEPRDIDSPFFGSARSNIYTCPMSRTTDLSRKLQQRAERVIPGGVDSPVRAFRAVGGEPPFIVRAKGSRLWDADGNEYIDYVGSWGPMVLGHAYPAVVEAIQKAATNSASFGASTPSEIELAELVIETVPSIEKVRFVSSGTEATMSAIRLSRAFTNRKYIVKFEGCYHGHADSLLVKAGSGVATLGIPGSAGVIEELAQFTLALPFNEIKAVEKAFAKYPNQIACLIVEPVVGNMGCVLPRAGYLQALRELTRRAGTVFICDEVMTGFRVAYGGAQQIYEITPDLTCLGKIIGGGLPVGAYGGKAEIMNMVTPLGPMYQAGTLSGNPLAMAAGITTLKRLKADGTKIYADLERK